MTKLILKNYEINVGGINNFTHICSELPEDLCKEMTDFIDNGPRYSNDCRYIFYTSVLKQHKGIRFGTAKAAVQCTISKFFKQTSKGNETKLTVPRYLIIKKINEITS